MISILIKTRYRNLFLLPVLLLFAACAETDPEVLFQRGDYVEAMQIWQARAGQGDLLARNYLGIHYYLGLGTRRDYRQAHYWYELAARDGFPDAQYNLALLYESGKGVEQDYFTAFKWFVAAYEQGNDNALKHLKRISGEHKLMPNQMAYAHEEAKLYIFHRVERKEAAPRKNY